MRVLLAVLVFMFSLSGWVVAPSAKEEPARRPHSQDNKSGANTNQQQAAPVITITNNLAPASETKPNSKEHSESAASAEERVALWTERLTYITGALVVATLLLWIAAIQTFRVSKKTAERQLRAYIGIKECSIVSETKDNFTRHFLHVSAHNFGPTPAKAIEYWIEKRDWKVKDIPTFERHESDIRHLGIINPGDKLTSKLGLDGLDTNSIWSGIHVAYVFGQFKYIDVFGKPWKTNLRFTRSGNDWLNDGEWEICSDGNDAT